jgi:hypothetical protein
MNPWARLSLTSRGVLELTLQAPSGDVSCGGCVT